MMSCCPPGSCPGLSTQGNAIGKVIETPIVSYYAVGDCQSFQGSIILVADIFGWNGGRTRLIADWLANTGKYYVVVAKLLVPSFRGGTDGDGKLYILYFNVPFMVYRIP